MNALNSQGGPTDIAKQGVKAPRPAYLAMFTGALIVGWAIIGMLAFQINQSQNALTATWQKDSRQVVQTFLPEQWAFFTKSPREAVLLPFAYSERDEWSSISEYPHSRAAHAFGWDRKSRAQGIEIGLVYSGMKASDWVVCSDIDSVFECLGRETSASKSDWPTVNNPSPDPTLCGTVALSSVQPDPWAWRSQGLSGEQISVSIVDVKC